MKKNWKTSFLGIGTIVSGIAQFVAGNQAEAIGLIMSGIGLLFSKDYDISGK
jgi:hypothetical protein